MNDEKLTSEQPISSSTSEPVQSHLLTTGLGAAIGKSVAGRVGALIGGVAGALAGSRAGEVLADFAQEANDSLRLGWGANDKAVELPQHYSWEELQALSKPQKVTG